MELAEYKNVSMIEFLFGQAFEETNVLYRNYLGNIVGESTVMVLDFQKELGHEFVKAKVAVELFDDLHQGGGWNAPTATEYLHAFLRDIEFVNRKELHATRFAFISHVQVFDEYKGNGCGKTILKQVIDFCENDGVQAVFLYPSPFGTRYEEEADKIEATERLYRFYGNAGFQEYEFGDSHITCPEHTAYMKLELPLEKVEEKVTPLWVAPPHVTTEKLFEEVDHPF